MSPEQFTKAANHGIIGLGPAPWDGGEFERFTAWPTEGYDGAFFAHDWEQTTTLGQSGHTREEWLALADAMIARWTAWKAHVATL